MDTGNNPKEQGEGRIKSLMLIEVLAANEEMAKSSLKDLIDKLKAEKGVEVIKADFKEIQKVENPVPGIKEAFSQVVEIELISKAYETLVGIVMNYGPSSIEILEPSSLKIGVGEAQAILNDISDLIHRFAAVGIGGLVITDSSKKNHN